MPASVSRLTLLVTAAVLLPAGVAGAASTDPQVDIVPADQAWAESIVLKQSDLGPGWIVKPESGGSSDNGSESDGPPFCPGAEIDASDLTVTGGAGSPDFARGDSSGAVSDAVVWQTRDQARAYFDRTNAVMPTILDCLASLFKSLSSKEIEVVVTSAGAIPFIAVAPRTAAYRIQIVFSSTERVRGKLRKTSSRASLDTLLLGNGRATAFIYLDVYGRKPFRPGYEFSLAATTTARMSSDPAATP